jgi:hypothetical protein
MTKGPTTQNMPKGPVFLRYATGTKSWAGPLMNANTTKIEKPEKKIRKNFKPIGECVFQKLFF